MTVHITIEGNLIADPRPGQLPDNTPVANFTVACNTSKKDGNGGWEESGSQLFGVAAFRGQAEGVLNNLRKGTPVVVSGRLKFRTFTTKEGVQVTALEIDADSIGYSLRFHDVQGGRRQAGGGAGAQGSAASYYGQPQQAPQQQAPQGYGQPAAQGDWQQPQQQAPQAYGQQQPQAQQAWGQPAVQQPPANAWTDPAAAAAQGSPWGQEF